MHDAAWNLLNERGDPVNTPKYIAALILSRVQIKTDAPWQFRIRGKAGGSTSRQESAHIAWAKIRTWAERIGAETALLEDEFAQFYASDIKAPLGQRCLVVEITDPAARIIEDLLQAHAPSAPRRQ